MKANKFNTYIKIVNRKRNIKGHKKADFLNCNRFLFKIIFQINVDRSIIFFLFIYIYPPYFYLEKEIVSKEEI